VRSDVLRPAAAAPVAVEAGQRLGAAGLERPAQHVALVGGIGLHGRSWLLGGRAWSARAQDGMVAV
jgi:hypothetical protein